MPQVFAPRVSFLPVITASCLLVAAGLPRHAAGHGTPFLVGYDTATGKITVSPKVYRNFDTEELFVNDSGFILNDGTPGWTRASSLPSGTSLDIRFLAPLLYWNPQTDETAPLPTPNASLVIDSIGGTTTVAAADAENPSGITGVNPSLLASFTSHHHVVWEILDPDQSGLYGLWARLESTDPMSFAAQPSDPFLVVLNWGITNSTNYNDGVDRLAATAVPEPSTLALVGAAFAAAGWRWRHSLVRRRDRRRRS